MYAYVGYICWGYVVVVVVFSCLFLVVVFVVVLCQDRAIRLFTCSSSIRMCHADGSRGCLLVVFLHVDSRDCFLY